MLFNSIDFAIFLPIVFFFYWFIFRRNLRLQNFFLLAASYIFYGWWDWRFLGLILFSTIVDYLVGLSLGKTDDKRKRKLLLAVSLTVNLGLLGFFKYYNFFIDNFVSVFKFFGHDFNPKRLNIVLPVGISFYTFQTLSYSIDVFRKKIEPTKDFISFAAFVSFFPQLVAGPIERASNLLPQFSKDRVFSYAKAVDGVKQMLWGFFKKMVIADNAAFVVNDIFSKYDHYNGMTLLLGGFLFAFQIYGDFSGYSDIAIGTARLFGFNLMRNFAYPYFSRDIAEFWRRWHISLSTWFRDYLYIPLGGSRVSLVKRIRNIFIIFIVSGFWHGANWTFIIWGALNAIYYLPLMLIGKNRSHLNIVAESSMLPSVKELIQMAITFFLTIIAWIFFRSQTVIQAFEIVKKIFSFSLFNLPDVYYRMETIRILILIIFFVVIEWFGRRGQYAIEKIVSGKHFIVRYSFYGLIVFLIMMLMYTKKIPFIYFQF